MKNRIKMICIIIVALTMIGIVGSVLYTHNNPVHVVNPTPKPDFYYQVGDTVVIDSVALTVEYAEFCDDSEYIGIERGYRPYGVLVKVDNIANYHAYFDHCKLKAYADGILCEPYLFGENTIGSFYLDVGHDCSGSIYYLVPENAENISLEYEWEHSSSFKILFKVK